MANLIMTIARYISVTGLCQVSVGVQEMYDNVI